jgi:hypothetical protein
MAKCLSGASDWYCTGIFDRGTPATNSFSGTSSHWSGSPAVERTYSDHLGLLGAYRERPYNGRASNKLDEIAPSHCLPRGSGQGHGTGSN